MRRSLKWFIISTLVLWGMIIANEAFSYEITIHNESQYTMNGYILWRDPLPEWSPNGDPVIVACAELEPGEKYTLKGWDDTSRHFVVRWLLSHINQNGNMCPDEVLRDTYQHIVGVPALQKDSKITISQLRWHIE